MDEATDETSRASSSSQSFGQTPHLCEACLSVLARDNLELTRYYPHHSNLEAFIEAYHTRCYVCSYLFSLLKDVGDQENLELLARGKPPDEKIINKHRVVSVHLTDFRENHPDPVQRAARFREHYDQPTSFVSFTMMRLRRWDSWGPLDPNNPRDAAYWQIQALLNPMYEAYIPPPLTAYRSSLRDLWKNVSFDIDSKSPLVLTQQEFGEVGLVERLPSNTGSKETWATVEGWLRECSEQHTCLAITNKDWYPTRLVEVLSDDMFRIVRSDSSSFKPGRGYITLSHRWGHGDFLRLTTENISALEDEHGQPITILRKIFQDALEVARRMDIPYIWIDSLCIIQAGDDFADWRKESSTMAEVYSNSRCNISADWGDDYHGLFFERDPPYDRPCSLQLRLSSPETSDGVLAESRTPPDVVPAYIILPYSWMEDVMEAPLNRRGWVVQERQLAPRVLHFSPQQVSWECCEKVTFEKVPFNMMLKGGVGRVAAELDPIGLQRKRMKRLRLHNPQKAVDWPRIVAHYSACGLTKQQDILVAIAGIARRLRPVVNDLYVAGLWAKSLPTGLLWKRTAPKERRSPPAEYIAPTFSWAASDGEITLVNAKHFAESQIIASAVFIRHRVKPLPCSPTEEARPDPSASDEILTDDVFGPLASPEAEVRVRGILRSCGRVPPLPDPHSQPFSTRACPSTDPEDPGIQTCLENSTVLEIYDDRNAHEGDERADSTMYYYTIIAHSIVQPITDPVSAQYAYNSATGLLLRSVDAAMGRFERVGRVEYSRLGGAADILEPLGNERDLPAWSYDEVTGEHTFYII